MDACETGQKSRGIRAYVEIKKGGHMREVFFSHTRESYEQTGINIFQTIFIRRLYYSSRVVLKYLIHIDQY